MEQHQSLRAIPPRVLSAVDLARSHDDGFVILRGFLDKDILAQLALGAQHLTDGFLDRVEAQRHKENNASLLIRCSESGHGTRLKDLCVQNPGLEDRVPIIFRPELHDQ